MSEASSTVTYKQIPDHPGYRIGSDGSLWTRLKPGPARNFYVTWRRRNLRAGPSGYVHVILSGEFASRAAWLHRLVLEAFVGPCPEGMEACHYNGIRSDNRLENLRWDTVRANCADAARHGTQYRGRRHWKNKLTESEVREVRRLCSSGLGMTAVGKQFGISQIHVKRIITGKAWAWLK